MIALADRQARNGFITTGRQQLATSQRNGQRQSSVDLARRWTAMGGIVADLAPRDGTASRIARLNVSFGLLAQTPTPWAARFWEPHAPPGVQPVEWLLPSRSAICSFEDALELLHEAEDLVTEYTVN